MKEWITELSNKIWNKKNYQYIFFGLASIFTILFMGYYFGTFDQVIHIPFLKKIADPSLYPNDPFLDLRNYHYSYFWYFFLPFYRLGMLEIFMFILHFISVYLTYWSIWKLSKTLFNNPLASFLSVLTFIIPHIGFAAFPVFEFSLLNRSFVLPFLLLAFDFYLKNKYLTAFFILGLMYNLHVISVNFVLAMIIFDMIIQIKTIKFKNIIYSIFTFLTSASPVLIWKFGNSKIDFNIHKEWFEIIYNGFMYHIYAIVTTKPLILFIVIGGFSLFFSFFITLKKSQSKLNSTITNFMICGLLILILEAIASLWFPITIIIQSQIIRVGVLIIIFTYLYASNYLSQIILGGEDTSSMLLVLSGLVLSVTPISLLISLIGHSFGFAKKIKYILITLIIISGFTYLLLTRVLDIWRPGIEIYPPKNALNQAQLWAKNNTSKEDIFIVPPYLWWFYNTEWRVLSEGSIVVDLSDLLESSFYPSYINYWKLRFEDVAPGALSQFKGDYFENVKITKKAYGSLSEQDVLKISKKYKARYFVSEKPRLYQFPAAYENRQFVIYDLNLVK